jgi:CheY-like chemotaxis protein
MSRKILIVDESDAIRSVAVNIFRQRGHEVLTSSTGAEAWEILKTGKIDLAIVNSSLSGIDGYTLSRLMKEDASLHNTKSILMMSPSEIVNQHQLITAQPDGTLNKPFSPPDLLAKAGDVLGEEFEPLDQTDGSNMKGAVAEMEMSEDEIAKEIDFDSIFDDDTNSDIEDVQLAEVFPEKLNTDDINDSNVTEVPANSVDTNPVPDENPKESDVIRLADDQYGMEEPLEPSEIETPHDYNWFIREMKNDVISKGNSKKKPEKAPEVVDPMSDRKPTGHFTVEEMGTSRIYVGDEKKDATVDEMGGSEPAQKQNIASEENITSNGGSSDDKLVLAEKLLIKELASRLSEKIIHEIPRDKLREMLNELLSELKKY